jgi:Spy/CpxP family protein refolding chaperone
MNKSRIWLIIVVALLLANTAVLVTLWMKKPPAPPPGGSAKDFLVSELKLTVEQQKQFDALREDHQKNTRAVMEGMKDLKDALAEKISAGETDTAGLDSLTKTISEKERQRDLATFYHFRAFRAILSNDQKEKFDKILKQVLRMMTGPQRPPEGPPPGEKGDGPPPVGDEHPDQSPH